MTTATPTTGRALTADDWRELADAIAGTERALRQFRRVAHRLDVEASAVAFAAAKAGPAETTTQPARTATRDNPDRDSNTQVTTKTIPAQELRIGMRIVDGSSNLKITGLRYGRDHIHVSVNAHPFDFRPVEYIYANNDVVAILDDQAKPEPEAGQGKWPTAPLIRIIRGYDSVRDDISDELAIRDSDGDYRTTDAAWVRGEDQIYDWEDMTPIPTALIAELREHRDAMWQADDDDTTSDYNIARARLLATTDRILGATDN